MKPTGMWVAGLIFGVIALVIYLVITFSGVGKQAEEPTPTFPPALFEGIVVEDISRIEVRDRQAKNPFVATQAPDGTWSVVTLPEGITMPDTSTISTAVAALPSLIPTRTFVDMEPTKEMMLGEDARYEITLLVKGTEYKLIVGAKAPGGQSYYVQLPESSNIYLISTYNLDALLGLASLPATPTPDASASASATPTLKVSASATPKPEASATATP